MTYRTGILNIVVFVACFTCRNRSYRTSWPVEFLLVGRLLCVLAHCLGETTARPEEPEHPIRHREVLKL